VEDVNIIQMVFGILGRLDSFERNKQGFCINIKSRDKKL
jgi:hypothetical protein